MSAAALSVLRSRGFCLQGLAIPLNMTRLLDLLACCSSKSSVPSIHCPSCELPTMWPLGQIKSSFYLFLNNNVATWPLGCVRELTAARDAEFTPPFSCPCLLYIFCPKDGLALSTLPLAYCEGPGALGPCSGDKKAGSFAGAQQTNKSARRGGSPRSSAPWPSSSSPRPAGKAALKIQKV